MSMLHSCHCRYQQDMGLLGMINSNPWGDLTMVKEVVSWVLAVFLTIAHITSCAVLTYCICHC